MKEGEMGMGLRWVCGMCVWGVWGGGDWREGRHTCSG